MEFRDIIFLIVAISVWIYSSYRKLQQEAAKRAKKIKEEQTVQQTVIPDVVTKPQQRKEKVIIKQATRKPITKKPEILYTADREKKEAEDFWKNFQKQQETSKVENINIDKQVHISTSHSLINEIRSGKTDWKRAIILSEIIRPVYFK